MKVYHVSREDDPEFLFEPRVPTNRLADENSTAKRICVAPTIDQAIMGVWGVAVEKGVALDTPIIKECDTTIGRKKDCTFKRVYCADARPVKPRKVPDAKFTGELWLEEPTLMTLEGQIGTFSEKNVNYWFWVPYGADAYHRWKRDTIAAYKRANPPATKLDKDMLAHATNKKSAEVEAIKTNIATTLWSVPPFYVSANPCTPVLDLSQLKS